jgi:formate dehydrogenase (hydrogenase)
MPKQKTVPGSYPRLTQPLVRENGILRTATWDEALDVAAEGFRRNLTARGANSLGIFSCS